MTDEDRLAGWQAQFQGLLDPHATQHDVTLDVDRDENLSGLRRQLRALYAERPDINGVMVRIEGTDVGIATRATADRDAGTAGETAPAADPGASDGATLPGLPSEYRPVLFSCPQQGCSVQVITSFYDDRRVPVCPEHDVTEVVL